GRPGFQHGEQPLPGSELLELAPKMLARELDHPTRIAQDRAEYDLGRFFGGGHRASHSGNDAAVSEQEVYLAHWHLPQIVAERIVSLWADLGEIRHCGAVDH